MFTFDITTLIQYLPGLKAHFISRKDDIVDINYILQPHTAVQLLRDDHIELFKTLNDRKSVEYILNTRNFNLIKWFSQFKISYPINLVYYNLPLAMWIHKNAINHLDIDYLFHNASFKFLDWVNANYKITVPHVNIIFANTDAIMWIISNNYYTPNTFNHIASCRGVNVFKFAMNVIRCQITSDIIVSASTNPDKSIIQYICKRYARSIVVDVSRLIANNIIPKQIYRHFDITCDIEAINTNHFESIIWALLNVPTLKVEDIRDTITQYAIKRLLENRYRR